jgi:uncharacterized protein (TIGR03437 family)
MGHDDGQTPLDGVRERADAAQMRRHKMKLHVLRLFTLAIVLFAASGAKVNSLSVAAQQTVVVVNAATYKTESDPADNLLAPDSIAAAFGAFVTQGNQSFAAALPLPTSLGGVRVTVFGMAAQLFSVSPTQINFAVPGGLPPEAKDAPLVVTNADNTVRNGRFKLGQSAPGLFSVRANGRGVAAALTTFDGVTYENVFDADLNERVVEPGTPERRNILVLFGTGIRGASTEAVTVRLQGVPALVLFADAAPGFTGLDQLNVQISPEMAGLGLINVVVTVRNPNNELAVSNTVTLKLGGSLPPIRTKPIGIDQTVNGELSRFAQIQPAVGGSTYFFDAYRLTDTSAGNLTVAIDARSGEFDTRVLFYESRAGRLVQAGEDDDQGGLPGPGGGTDALFMTLIPPRPGSEWIIIVTSSSRQPNGEGEYTLRIHNQPMREITFDASLNGELAASDLQTSGGAYLDAYYFFHPTGPQNNVQIRMASTQLDASLILRSNEGEFVGANDNENPGTRNSLIALPLSAPGAYLILATAAEADRTGAYTLTLNRSAGFAALGVEAGKAKVGTGFAEGRRVAP